MFFPSTVLSSNALSPPSSINPRIPTLLLADVTFSLSSIPLSYIPSPLFNFLSSFKTESQLSCPGLEAVLLLPQPPVSPGLALPKVHVCPASLPSASPLPKPASSLGLSFPLSCPPLCKLSLSPNLGVKELPPGKVAGQSLFNEVKSHSCSPYPFQQIMSPLEEVADP